MVTAGAVVAALASGGCGSTSESPTSGPPQSTSTHVTTATRSPVATATATAPTPISPPAYGSLLVRACHRVKAAISLAATHRPSTTPSALLVQIEQDNDAVLRLGARIRLLTPPAEYAPFQRLLLAIIDNSPTAFAPLISYLKAGDPLHGAAYDEAVLKILTGFAHGITSHEAAVPIPHAWATTCGANGPGAL
jgi:hypothetical protein